MPRAARARAVRRIRSCNAAKLTISAPLGVKTWIAGASLRSAKEAASSVNVCIATPVYRFARGRRSPRYPYVAGLSGCSAVLRSAYLRLFRTEKTDGAQVSWRPGRRDRLTFFAPLVLKYASARLRSAPGLYGRRGAETFAVPGACRRDLRCRAEPPAHRSFRAPPSPLPRGLPRP